MRLHGFRRRVVLVRFVLPFLLLLSLFVLAFHRPSNRDAISHTGGTLNLVDALLDEALHSALSIGLTHQDHDGSRPHLKDTKVPLGPTSHQAPPASSAAIVSDTLRAQVCRILQGRTLFLVGPHDTLYQLHSFLLRTLHASEPPGATTAPATVPTTRASCPGPSSCPFHPLCHHRHPIDSLSQSPSLSSSPPPPGPEPFTPADIATSTNRSSGFLRFLHSGNLNPSPTQEDSDPQLGIGVPLVDPRTGVRVVDSRWVRQVASKASILILNRGPLPAPAWSYGDKEKDKGDSISAARNNLTWLSILRALEKQHAEPPLSSSPFADVLSRLDHLLLLPSASHDDDFQKRLLSAALHSTISTFLPSLLSTLTKLREHAGHRAILGKKPVLWYGSWFLPLSCAPDSLSVFSQNSNSDPRRLLARLLAQAEAVHNPWSAYYNAQVYMHDRLLARLLPAYGVIYLSSLSTLVPSEVGQTDRQAQDWSCIQHVFETPRGAFMGRKFLGDLGDALGSWNWGNV
ncbi:hypothetical protein BJV74DRAFT_827424 [Russula compacta]|nr:hypothetical protein BJV74DRAFT_827424 [Russula compacta]